MITRDDILQIILIIVSTVALVFVLRWRKRSHAKFMEEYAERELCEHLRPALELLRSRGHRVVRAGQQNPEMPLEIHLAPAFDPAAIAAELSLKKPVSVSPRNALVCKEDFCELRPAG